MKAAIRRAYCSPRDIKVEEITKPIPKDHEILVKICATTVNRTDIAILTAKPFIMRFVTGLLKPKSPILGTDFSGTVASIGTKVKNFNVNDNVWGFNDQCLASQAEYMCISEKATVTKAPKNSSLLECVAGIEGAHYAINMINKVKLAPGQNAIVNGGTGAIGSALIQFLTYYGISVTATCESVHQDKIKSIGAVHTIDYTNEDFTEYSEKFNYVFDAVGKSTFGKCKKLLKKKGIYISSELGPYSQNVFLSILSPFINGKSVRFPIPLNPSASLAFNKKLIEEGTFNPLIDKTYTLNDISEAYNYVASGEKIGNVIIEV